MKNGRMLFAVAGLLCLMSHTFSESPPSFDPSDLFSPNLSDDGMGPRIEQDIIDPPLEQTQAVQEISSHKRAIGVRDQNKRWTNKTVNYMIEKTFKSWEKALIQKAMDEIEHYTCVTFENTTTAANRVEFKKGNGRCFSYIGMKGGRQTLQLANGCIYYRTILHEITHALGLLHEHKRPNRDNYIKINFKNIKKGRHGNFAKYSSDMINNYNAPYDYYSIMHYDENANANSSGLQTIVTKNSSVQSIIGRINGLSLGDIRTINRMYSCVPASCTLRDSACGKNGFVGKDCLCWCPGPKNNHPVEYCSKCDKKAKGSLDFRHECKDISPHCAAWAKAGVCQNSNYLMYMFDNCRKACNFCD